MTDKSAGTEVSVQVEAGFAAVHAACALRGIQVVRHESGKEGVLCVELSGRVRTWLVHVECAEEFFRLPRVQIRPGDSLLAHVGYNGVVCIDDEQGLSIDRHRPSDVVAHAVMKAYDLLERSAADAASGGVAFSNELEGYWGGLPDVAQGRCYFEIDGQSRLLKGSTTINRKRPFWYFLEQEAEVPRSIAHIQSQAHRALYVHLDSVLPPPLSPHKLTPDFIEDVVHRMSTEQRALWAKLVAPSRNSPKRYALLVSVPRPAGGRSLIGVAFTAQHCAVDAKGRIEPLAMRRQTSTYMRERGGASLDLLGKHVVVIGAGAVGSVVADSLATAGVGQVTVVDYDEYTEDNVFRHVLPPLFIDMEKAVALKFLLEQRYPGIKVTSVCSTGQDWLETADLTNYDGVVFALGAPTQELAFSELLNDIDQQLPVVFTWLEALDLGGHSLLMWTKGEGCLHCLYRDDEGRPSLASRTAFLEPDQPVTRNLTGCASSFVPYGALQARRTGLMAAEHLLSELSVNGEEHWEQQASYRFWVGPGEIAARQGLRTTPWFWTAQKTSSKQATLMAVGHPCSHCRPN